MGHTRRNRDIQSVFSASNSFPLLVFTPKTFITGTLINLISVLDWLPKATQTSRQMYSSKSIFQNALSFGATPVFTLGQFRKILRFPSHYGTLCLRPPRLCPAKTLARHWSQTIKSADNSSALAITDTVNNCEDIIQSKQAIACSV